MSYSYPIWNDVTSCIYNSSKSYGARDTGEVTVRIGTSSKNSEFLCTHVTTRRIEGENTVFTFGVDYGAGFIPIVRRVMETKTRAWKSPYIKIAELDDWQIVEGGES